MTAPTEIDTPQRAVLVVSDLHLGARSNIDLLRRPTARQPLLDAVREADELVLLGDAVELREGPMGPALAAAQPVLEAFGEALGDRPVLLVPGNHDHRLLERWRERRAADGAGPLEAEQVIEPEEASDAAATLADWLAPARLRLAYPGAWLGERVYATHGHYLDRHITVPAFEPLAVRVLERLLARRLVRLSPAGGYEAVLTPLYALLHELAQTVPPRAQGRGHDPLPPSARAYRVLAARGARPLGQRLLSSVAFPAAVAALNAAGLAPLNADLSGPELRRSALRAMGEVVARLAVPADHVIFGHTHRAGPLPDDDAAEWTTATGTRLHNCGSWVRERFLGGAAPQRSPYRAGGAVVLKPGGAPQLRHLLDDPAYASAL